MKNYEKVKEKFENLESTDKVILIDTIDINQIDTIKNLLNEEENNGKLLFITKSITDEIRTMKYLDGIDIELIEDIDVYELANITWFSK